MLIETVNQEEREEKLTFINKRGTEIDKKIEDSVRRIINDVKIRKDEALKYYAKKFNNSKVEKLKIEPSEITDALHQIDGKITAEIEKFIRLVTEIIQNQKEKTWSIERNGVIIGQKIVPVESVGIFVPSSLQLSMLIVSAVSAKIAGVEKIFVSSSPNSNQADPLILSTCQILGIKDVFLVGGPQIIPAFAFGTETIPKVDKIIARGDIRTAIAMRLVSGISGTDVIAGSNETVIITDGKIDFETIALNIVTLSELNENSMIILVTTEKNIADEVNLQIEKILSSHPNSSKIEETLKNSTLIFLSDDIDDAIELANKISPAQVQILTENPLEILPKIKNAGAIILGKISPFTIVDPFVLGQVLPSFGTAKFSSPLSVSSFVKKINVFHFVSQVKEDFPMLNETLNLKTPFIFKERKISDELRR